MNLAHPERIAAAYLPRRRHYWYARSKLASDPLYRGVGSVVCESRADLLDLGCGLGLLAHTLRAQGFAARYVGLDNDRSKIGAAREAAERSALPEVRFECIDLLDGTLPAHHGNVALLDVLQFVPAPAAMPLLERAAACVAPGASLVVRTGLSGGDARSTFTYAVDGLSRLVGWMNAAPKHYPTQAQLERVLRACGLSAQFTPLGAPCFNNWLVVARRA